MHRKHGDGATPLHFAAMSGSLPYLQYVCSLQIYPLNAMDRNHSTALNYTLHWGQLQNAKFLVDQGLSVHTLHAHGSNALYILASAWDSVSPLDVIPFLREVQGLEIDSRNPLDLRTPLHYAAQKGKQSTIDAFIRANHPLFVRDLMGRLPLQ